jgi:PKD repeat protein
MTVRPLSVTLATVALTAWLALATSPAHAAPPKADFTCDPACSAPVGTTITFSATSDAPETLFAWDLNGDATFKDGSQQTVSFTYETPGTYDVGVRVTDAGTLETTTVVHQVTITKDVPEPPTGPFVSEIGLLTEGLHQPGTAVRFESRSTLPEGYEVVAHHWDFDDDGTWNANTGPYATAVHRYADPGVHNVRLQVEATDTSGNVVRSDANYLVDIAPPPEGCRKVLRRGFLEIGIGGLRCIESDDGEFSIPLDGGATIAGLLLTSNREDGKLILDTTGSNEDNDNPRHQWALRSEGVIDVSLVNTPIGTVTIGRLDLENDPVLLPPGADVPDQHAPGLRVFSIQARRNCNANAGAFPPVVCATLPGGFAIEGTVSAFVTAGDEGPGAAVELNLNLQRPITVTGRLTMVGEPTGVNVDEFNVRTGTFNVGPLITVDPMSLSYNSSHAGQRNVWRATAGGRLRVIPANPIGINLALRWADTGSWAVSVNARGRAPLGPVILTQLGGTIGFNPFLVGGNLAGSVGPLGLSAGMLYREAHNGEPWRFQLGTSSSNDPYQVAPLFLSYPSADLNVAVLKVGGVLNLYGDGFVSGGVDVTFRLPNINASEPVLNVQGYARGWFSPPTADVPHEQYQISGGVLAEAKLFIRFTGEMQGFVNSYWDDGAHHHQAAGCGRVSADLGPFGRPTVGGWVRVDMANGNRVEGAVDFSGAGCSNISAYCAPADVTGDHEVPPCLGFEGSSRQVAARRATSAMSSAPQEFWIPGRVGTENIKLTSATGIPQVTINGPSGSYTTPAAPESTGQAPYISGAYPEQHELLIAIDRPEPGAYTITPVEGSPPIAPVLEAHPMPDPKLRVRIEGQGRKRVLRYSMRTAPRQTVQFTERANDVSTVIGTARDARGSIRFRPQVATAHKRTIVAQFFESSVPQQPRTVARYRAPAPPRLGRPGEVRVARKRNRATISWDKAAHAAEYLVTVSGSDGRRETFVRDARRARRVVMKPVYREVGLKVRVSALGGLDPKAGSPQKVRLRPNRASARS